MLRITITTLRPLAPYYYEARSANMEKEIRAELTATEAIR